MGCTKVSFIFSSPVVTRRPVRVKLDALGHPLDALGHAGASQGRARPDHAIAAADCVGAVVERVFDLE